MIPYVMNIKIINEILRISAFLLGLVCMFPVGTGQAGQAQTRCSVAGVAMAAARTAPLCRESLRHGCAELLYTLSSDAYRGDK